MCSGDRLVADFVAGTGAQPGLPGELEEHLTTTADGLWVVWAYKVARQAGDRFIPLTGGSGYPADAGAAGVPGLLTASPIRGARAVSMPSPAGGRRGCRGCPVCPVTAASPR